MSEFWALDTETDNQEEGGQAILITIHGPAGGKELLFPKDFGAIWEFLKGREYVAFNADFDIQALCHDSFIPYKILRTLARFKSASWKGWRFKYVPTKFLDISRNGEKVVIYDLQQFYGSSLADSARKHCPELVGKKAIPRSWYACFRAILSSNGWKKSKVLDYARRDAEVCYNLCRRLVESFQAVGVAPKKLISPASLTMEFFGPQMKEEPELDDETNELWSQGFYGGRVEVATLGTIENVNLYDIHSAYPAEIAKLRSLKMAELIEGMTALPSDQPSYGLYHLTAYVPIQWRFGPLAVRDGGKVIYPVGAVKTWCCLPARRMLDSLGVVYDIHEAHEYLARDVQIFSGIENLYHSRKNPVLSLAAKLMLNSLYGKLCEARRERVAVGSDSYRSFRAYGRYTNYILAAHITESVRMRVFDVLHRFGIRAHMAATDSVLIEGEMPTGPHLGEWDLKGSFKTATILGCGRYFFTKHDGEREGYLRGFPGTRKHAKKIETCRRSYVRLPLLQNLSMLQWANGGAADDLNVLKSVRRELRCDDDKRAWESKFKRLADAFKFKINSQPWIIGTAAGLTKLNRIEDNLDHGRS